METPKTSPSGFNNEVSGSPFPVSHREIALSVTISFSANSFCVKPFSLLFSEFGNKATCYIFVHILAPC